MPERAVTGNPQTQRKQQSCIGKKLPVMSGHPAKIASQSSANLDRNSRRQARDQTRTNTDVRKDRWARCGSDCLTPERLVEVVLDPAEMLRGKVQKCGSCSRRDGRSDSGDEARMR